MVTLRNQGQQPNSLPSNSTLPANTSISASGTGHPQENKYFSVRGYKDFANKVSDKMGPNSLDQDRNQKYFSVDAKFLNQQGAADMKSKIRENLVVSNSQQQKPDLPQYYQPPPPPHYPPYQRPPPPQRQNSDLTSSRPSVLPKPSVKAQPPSSNLEASKAMSGKAKGLYKGVEL